MRDAKSNSIPLVRMIFQQFEQVTGIFGRNSDWFRIIVCSCCDWYWFLDSHLKIAPENSTFYQ